MGGVKPISHPLVLLRWFLRPFCPGAPASLHNAEINPGRYYFSYLPGMMLCLFRVLMMGSGEFFRGQEQRSHIKQPCECGRRRQSSRWQRKAACTPEHPWPRRGQVRGLRDLRFPVSQRRTLSAPRGASWKEVRFTACATPASDHDRCLELQLTWWWGRHGVTLESH